MARRFKVFHSGRESILKSVRVLLVRPENPQNIGAAARAISNMGIGVPLGLVSSPSVIDENARKLARHAGNLLDSALFFDSLKSAFSALPSGLKVAITARLGSRGRPHPRWIHEASSSFIKKLELKEVESVTLVFGPESDGLSNEEVGLCDWIVGIPSDPGYRSLNLAQAVMVAAYELRRATLIETPARYGSRLGQKNRLIAHIIQVAEAAGFILPGDPFKMRPRLEQLFSELPNHVKDIKTFHGLLDQVARSIGQNAPDFKGRYRRLVKNEARSERNETGRPVEGR